MPGVKQNAWISSWVDFNPSMDNELRPLLSVGWNSLSIPSLQREWMTYFHNPVIWDVMTLMWYHYCQAHSAKCVSKIKSVLSIFQAIYGAVCIQLTHFCYADCENTCTLSYYHHQIGRMTPLPLFRVRSWNNGMCCMSLSYHHHQIGRMTHFPLFRVRSWNNGMCCVSNICSY